MENTYTAKILIQQLHIAMDDLQGDQLVVLVLYGTAEIQAGVSETGHSEHRGPPFCQFSKEERFSRKSRTAFTVTDGQTKS